MEEISIDKLLHFDIKSCIISIIVVIFYWLISRFSYGKPIYLVMPFLFVLSYIIFTIYNTSFCDKQSSNQQTSDNTNKNMTLNPDRTSKDNALEPSCPSCSAGGENTSLLPIMEPKFNLKETAKHLILLEDHLFHKGKRCPDCILKHCYTIDAFLDECITLDVKKEFIEITVRTQLKFKELYKKISQLIRNQTMTDDDCCEIAQELRKIRKPLVYITADI